MHALTGADHISAIFSLCVNKRFSSSAWYGFIWGLGHGITSGILGLIGYMMSIAVADFRDITEEYRYLGDFMIAVTLLIIGGMGIYENLATGEGKDETEVDTELNSSGESSNKSDRNKAWNMIISYSIVFMNGMLLGLSWDGLPSLTPTVVIKQQHAIIGFLLSYMIGTIVVMTFVAGLIGEASYWLSKRLNPSDLTNSDSTNSTIADRLSYLSSLSACLIGCIWLISSLIKCHQFWRFLERSTASYNDNVVLSQTDGFWSVTMLERWESKVSITLNILSGLVVIGTVLLGVFVDPTKMRAIWTSFIPNYRMIYLSCRANAVQSGLISSSIMKSKVEHV